ncbi:hypothetical protein OH76DRAFT_1029319 [Lentinus brumalis]|uniref:Uncharacterized protein n=1 Tax=Lentinus brumalis TaxID=2498619 RepID=A0A371CXD0_9APHY|nr:hypothetical protein OH76DRAFT_1029319 [Polyporus brumalis]
MPTPNTSFRRRMSTSYSCTRRRKPCSSAFASVFPSLVSISFAFIFCQFRHEHLARIHPRGHDHRAAQRHEPPQPSSDGSMRKPLNSILRHPDRHQLPPVVPPRNVSPCDGHPQDFATPTMASEPSTFSPWYVPSDVASTTPQACSIAARDPIRIDLTLGDAGDIDSFLRATAVSTFSQVRGTVLSFTIPRGVLARSELQARKLCAMMLREDRLERVTVADVQELLDLAPWDILHDLSIPVLDLSPANVASLRAFLSNLYHMQLLDPLFRGLPPRSSSPLDDGRQRRMNYALGLFCCCVSGVPELELRNVRHGLPAAPHPDFQLTSLRALSIHFTFHPSSPPRYEDIMPLIVRHCPSLSQLRIEEPCPIRATSLATLQEVRFENWRAQSHPSDGSPGPWARRDALQSVSGSLFSIWLLALRRRVRHLHITSLDVTLDTYPWAPSLSPSALFCETRPDRVSVWHEDLQHRPGDDSFVSVNKFLAHLAVEAGERALAESFKSLKQVDVHITTLDPLYPWRLESFMALSCEILNGIPSIASYTLHLRYNCCVQRGGPSFSSHDSASLVTCAAAEARMALWRDQVEQACATLPSLARITVMASANCKPCEVTLVQGGVDGSLSNSM